MPGPVWHCRTPIHDVLLAWEGEQHAVFFDPVSGDTHLIAALGAQLAEWLSEQPLARDALLRRLAQAVEWDETPPPDALADLLDLHLSRLAEVHLLVEVPADVPAQEPIA